MHLYAFIIVYRFTEMIFTWILFIYVDEFDINTIKDNEITQYSEFTSY